MEGHGDAADRDQQRRENQREQSYLCSKFVRRLEEQEALSLESQVVGIKRQDEIDAQQDQRLEAIVSALAGREGCGGGTCGFWPSQRPQALEVCLSRRELMPLAVVRASASTASIATEAAGTASGTWPRRQSIRSAGRSLRR